MLLINQIHIGRRQKSPEICREHEMSLFLSEASTENYNTLIVNGELSVTIGSASKDLEEQEDEARRSLLSLKPCLFGHLGMSPHTDTVV